MLITRGVENIVWVDKLVTATYLQNHVPRRHLEISLTPLEVRTGRGPELNFIRISGLNVSTASTPEAIET